MNKVLKLFKSIKETILKKENGTVTSHKDKIIMSKVICLLFTFLGAVMSYPCYQSGNVDMLYISIGYAVFMLINFFIILGSKKLGFFYGSIIFLILALEFYYLIFGGSQGFSLLWFTIFPLLSIFLMDRFLFLGFNITITLIIILGLWTPLYKFCWQGYSYIFHTRFPMIIILDETFTIYFKYKLTKSETKKQQALNELQNMKDTLEIQVQERTEELKREKQEKEKLSIQVITALAGTIDAKDKYTSGHSHRVADYSRKIAQKLGKNEEEQDTIYLMALLHDIGKIGVPNEIINKPGRLTDEEYELLKKHSTIGAEILNSITSMKNIGDGARWHHERYDGKGYPDHIKNTEIPEAARIISVADAYDAMTSNRSYRTQRNQEYVREEITKGKGSQFDPKIADKMLELIDEDKDFTMHE